MNFSCPQCGFALTIKNSKLSICTSCGSSLLIENDSISISELKVSKNTDKSLFRIGNTIKIRNSNYMPKGYSLYEYGLHEGLNEDINDEKAGHRVEWELSLVDDVCVDDESTDASSINDVDIGQNEKHYFLNQEDENLFLVKQIPDIQQTLPEWELLQPNTQLKIKDKEWLVVEQLKVNFVGYYGALQNLPLQNNKLKCSYLSNTEGECLVLTFTQDSLAHNKVKAFQGWWLDPMDLS